MGKLARQLREKPSAKVDVRLRRHGRHDIQFMGTPKSCDDCARRASSALRGQRARNVACSRSIMPRMRPGSMPALECMPAPPAESRMVSAGSVWQSTARPIDDQPRAMHRPRSDVSAAAFPSNAAPCSNRTPGCGNRARRCASVPRSTPRERLPAAPC